MDSLGAGDGRRREDGRNVEIGIARRGRPDADALVGEADMHGVGVAGRVDGDRLDAHVAAGAVDAQRDLAAVGDQDLLEHLCYSRTITTSPYSTGGPSSTRTCAGRGLAALGEQDLLDPPAYPRPTPPPPSSTGVPPSTRPCARRPARGARI